MRPYICTAQLFSQSGRCLAHLCRERRRLHGLPTPTVVLLLLWQTCSNIKHTTHSTQHQNCASPRLCATATSVYSSRTHSYCCLDATVTETSSRYASPWPLPEFLFCCLELTANDGLGCPQALCHSTPRVRFAPSWTSLAVWRRRNPPQVPAGAVFGAIEVLGPAIWG